MNHASRTIDIDALTPHPESHRIPEMREPELQELADDILDRGMRQPIELVGTKTIIDGRERWKAAKRAGIKRVPVVDANLNGEDPVIYMLRSATRRRHLTDDQRAMLAREELVYLAEKGKAARVAKLVPGGAKVPGMAAFGADRKSLSGKAPLVEATAVSTSGYVAGEIVWCSHLRSMEDPSAWFEVRLIDGIDRQGFFKVEGLSVGVMGGKTHRTQIHKAKPSAPVERSRVTVAKSHGLSERQLRNAELVSDRAPDLAAKVRAGELDLARAVSQVRRDEKIETSKQKAKVAAAAARASLSIGELPWSVVTGDCIVELPRILRPEKPRIIFVDPKYNEGVDYGNGERADRLADPVYLAWCQEWMELCAEGLADDGSLWVLISKEYAGRFDVLLRETGLHFRDLVVWYETFGVNCSGKFNRCCRVLFRFDKHPKRRVFHAHAVSRPSDRQTKYNDPRANPNGKILDDFWEIGAGGEDVLKIPRLVGSAGERVPQFRTQLPKELMRRVIACASDPGDLIVDPSGGSGTTAHAAIELGRRATLIEINPTYADLSRERLTIATHHRLATKGKLLDEVTKIEKRNGKEAVHA